MFTLFTNNTSVNFPNSQLGDVNQLVSDKLNVTASDFKLYNVNKTWNTNTSFVAGDIVVNVDRPGRLTYLCTQGGTSSASGLGPQGTLTQQTDGTCVWDYIDAANPLYFRTVLSKLDSGPVDKNSNIQDGTGTLRWRNVSHPSVGWKTSTAYTLGTVVFNQGNNYVCSVAGTSNSTGSGPSSTGTNIVDGVGTLRWDYLAQMPRPWTKSTAYQIGAIVTNGSLRITYRYYICTEAGTSASSGGPLTESGSITDGSVTWQFIPDWQAKTSYSLDTYVNNSGMIYKCTTAGTSGLNLNSTGRTPVNVWSISDQVQAGGSLNQKGALSNWEITHTLGLKDGDVTQSWGGERAATFRINFGEANASVNSLTPWIGSTPATNPFWVGSGIRFTRGGVAPEAGYASGSHLQYYNSIVNNIYRSDNWSTNTVYRVGKRVTSVLTKQTYYCKVAGTSYKSSIDWTATTSYSVGAIVYASGKNYKCTTGGTSGTTAPTGISESIPDGSVVWTYYDIFLDNPYSTNIQDGSAVWTFIRVGARNFNNQRFNEMGWWSDVNASTRTLSGQTLTIVSVDGMAPVEESAAYNVKRGNSLLSFGWKTAYGTSEQGYSGVDPLHGTLLAFHGTEVYNFPTAAYGVDLKDVNFNQNAINWAQGSIQGGSHANIQTGRIRLRNAWLESTSLGANLEVKGYQGIPKGNFLWRKINSWQAGPLQTYSTANSSTNHQVKVPSGMVYTCMEAIVGSVTEPSGYGGYISDNNGIWAWVPTFVSPWWQPGHSYQLGDQVQTTENNVYLCVVAGTSSNSHPTGLGTGIVDGSVTWRLKISPPSNWSASTTYNLGDCVQNSAGLYYICVQSPVGNQTSQLEPSGTGSQIQDGYLLWNFYSATSIRYWLASTSYSQGDIIYANSVYWWCTTSGNSASLGTGPSGSGDKTDGTVEWRSFTPQSALVNSNPSTAVVPAGLTDDKYNGTFRLRSFTSDRVLNQYSTVETVNTSVCEYQPPQGVVDLIVRETQTGRSEYVTFDSSTTTLHATPLTANLDDWYKDRYLAYYSGPCAGLKRLITAYNASTGELTTQPFPTSPTAGAQVIQNFNFNDSISPNENQLQNGWIWTVSGGTGTVVVDPEGGIALTGDGSNPACLDQEVTIGIGQQLPYATECTWRVGYKGGNVDVYTELVLTVSIGTTRGGSDIYTEEFEGSAAWKAVSAQFDTPLSGVSIWIRVSVTPAYTVLIRNVQMGEGDSATFLPGVRAGVESNPLTLYRHWQPKNILSLQSQGGDLEIGGSTTVNGLVSTTKHVLESTANTLTAAGTVRADALQLTASYNRLTTVASGTGVILPSSNVGARIVIFNSGANAVKVYAQGIETIDGIAGSTGVTLTNALRCEFICIADQTWISAQLGAASA
jgi:hypothetical protein